MYIFFFFLEMNVATRDFVSRCLRDRCECDLVDDANLSPSEISARKCPEVTGEFILDLFEMCNISGRGPKVRRFY